MAQIQIGSSDAFNSHVVEHECGTVAYLSGEGSGLLLAWSGAEWLPIAGTARPSEVSDELVVWDGWVADVMGNQQPEFVVQFFGVGMRPVGSVLSASAPDCRWSWHKSIDSCGAHTLYGGLAYDVQYGLIGSGFSGGCSVREGVRLEWRSDLRLFVARPIDRHIPICPEYTDRVDLPLFLCSKGWSIGMIQEALLDTGLSVDWDEHYGPGTQEAVIRYQQANSLPVNGLIDTATWTSMYPPGSTEAPDYDGNGVVTPNEIVHYTGGDEHG